MPLSRDYSTGFGSQLEDLSPNSAFSTSEVIEHVKISPSTGSINMWTDRGVPREHGFSRSVNTRFSLSIAKHVAAFPELIRTCTKTGRRRPALSPPFPPFRRQAWCTKLNRLIPFLQKRLWFLLLSPLTTIPQLLPLPFKDSTVRGRPLAVRPSTSTRSKLSTSHLITPDAGIGTLLLDSSFSRTRRSRISCRPHCKTIVLSITKLQQQQIFFQPSNSRTSCSRWSRSLCNLRGGTSSGSQFGVSYRMASSYVLFSSFLQNFDFD